MRKQFLPFRIFNLDWKEQYGNVVMEFVEAKFATLFQNDKTRTAKSVEVLKGTHFNHIFFCSFYLKTFPAW